MIEYLYLFLQLEIFIQEAAAPIVLPLNYMVSTKEEPFVIQTNAVLWIDETADTSDVLGGYTVIISTVLSHEWYPY